MLKWFLSGVLVSSAVICSGQVKVENAAIDSFYLAKYGVTKYGLKGKRVEGDIYRVEFYSFGGTIHAFSFDLVKRQIAGDYMEMQKPSRGDAFVSVRAETDTATGIVRREFMGLCQGAFHGTYVRMKPNGHMKDEKHYKQNKLHGTLKEWDLRDTLIMLENYKDGVLHGECRYWAGDGKAIRSMTYKEGKLDGEYWWWWFDGNKDLVDLKHFKDGVLHGECITRDQNDTVIARSNYINGKQVGRSINYFSNGMIERYTDYSNEGETVGGASFFNLSGDTESVWMYLPKNTMRSWHRKGRMKNLEVQDSVKLEWNLKGVLIYSKRYDKKAGSWIEKTFYDNGKIESIQKHESYMYSPVESKTWYNEKGVKLDIAGKEEIAEEMITEKTTPENSWMEASYFPENELSKITIPYSEPMLIELNRSLTNSLKDYKIRKKDKGRYRMLIEVSDNRSSIKAFYPVKVKARFLDPGPVNEELKNHITGIIENGGWTSLIIGNNSRYEHSAYVTITLDLVIE